MLAAIIGATRQWQAFRRASFKTPVASDLWGGGGTRVTVNWFTFVWAVNSGYVVETESRGSFINPLVNVLFGVLFLHERLRFGQWIAIGLRCCGRVVPDHSYGSPAMDCSGARAQLQKLRSREERGCSARFTDRTLETTILTPLAIAYCCTVERGGDGAPLHGGLRSDLLLALAPAR